MKQHKKRKRRLNLKSPRGVKVKRYIVGNQIRYTAMALLVDYPQQQWEKLVAIAECGTTSERFLWICKGFAS